MTGPAWRARVVALVAGAVLLLPVAACSSGSPDLDTEAAVRLQAGVLNLSEAVAAGDTDRAEELLELVRLELAESRAAGLVSQDRYVLVQDDLTQVADALAAGRDAGTG